MPEPNQRNPKPSHPYGPLAAIEDVRDSAFLMEVLTESAAAADPAAVPATWITDRLRVAWECAPGGGRRDALLTCAERAARAGVDCDAVRLPGDADRLPPVEAIAYLIQGVLLAHVRDDLAADLTVLPPVPWSPPGTASGRFASCTIDDFDQPEDAKILVCVRLLVAATVADRTRRR